MSKMAGLVKVPDSKTDWQAIDIYVFSNGQQYSPPRKYHLRSEDLNWWKSTLNFLARTQYGTLHSYIDLYTTDGKKIVSPLELSNGAPYVAVAPHDKFVDAGYDKYLIRASRSWEKRQAKKTSVAETDKSRNPTGSEDINDESTDLKTIVPSMMDHDTSVIVQPQPPSSVEQKSEPQQVLPAKPSDRKRPSVQRSSISRRITPPAPAVPNMKTAFKKKDSIKTANVKITRPEGERSSSVSNPVSKMTAKSKIYKPPVKSREASVQPEITQPKIDEAENEVKSSSSVKLTTINVTNISNGKVETNNVTEEKEPVANIYENPRGNMPSLAVDPNLIQYLRQLEENVVTPIPDEIERLTGQEDITNIDKSNKEIIFDATQNFENHDSHPRKHSIKIDEIADNQHTTYGVSYNVKENTNNGIIAISSNENKENFKNNNPTPRKYSKMSDKITDERLSTQVVVRNVDQSINMNHGDKTITPVSTPRKLSTMPDKVRNEHHSSQIANNFEQNTKFNNDVRMSIPINIPRKFSITPGNTTNEPLSVQDANNVVHSTNLNNDVNTSSPLSTPHKMSITPDKITDGRLSVQIARNVEPNSYMDNDAKTITRISNETVKTRNSLTPKRSSLGSKVSSSQYAMHNVVHVEENIDLNNEVITNPVETIKMNDITPSQNIVGRDKPVDDRYVTVLNKGDVVNLKLNIEIQNQDGHLIKLSDNANLHPVTNIQRTEKGSQINITNQMVVQTNSLLSMIAKEISDRHIGDNHLFIVVQCSGCKYCNDQNAAIPDVNKNYMILLPVKKFDDNILRCYCGDQNRNSSIVNPVKATLSCMSIQRLTKSNQIELPAETLPQVKRTSEANPDDVLLVQEPKVSDNETLTIAKKCVAIHRGCTPISRECSKISHHVNITTELVTVSTEFIEVLHKPGMDNSTQTDWCDVLLEARQLDDGHYSFRLPSLEILKYYNLT